MHLTSAVAIGAGSGGLLILYDRLWDGAVTMNSSAAQTVTGTPTRYTGAASKGNVMWPEVRSALAATAHNHTWTYVDDQGNAAEAAAVVAGVSGAVAHRLDFSTGGQWFVPLNSGDIGVRNITQWQASAAVATGNIDIVLAHPLVFIPLPASYGPGVLDGVNSAFGLTQILTDACLNFASVQGSATSTHYSGMLTLVSG